MKRITTLMVGVGGYGEVYLNELMNAERAKKFQLVGAVDPYADRSEYKEQLVKRGIPIYNSLEEFYRENEVELAIVSTPIHVHANQSIYCMQHGSHVLCEKPICATLEDANAMIETEKATGKKLAIGFQWSFSESIIKMKQDILDGVYGHIKRIKTLVCFPRNLDYYSRGNGWGGKRYLDSGECILDSVASNAAAHYLHNMFFLTGNDIDKSTKLKYIMAEVYRANPIEMFDTCALRVINEHGTEILFYATHAIPYEDLQLPILVVEGEKGTITLQGDEGVEDVQGVLNDGRKIYYDSPSVDHLRKLYDIAEAIEKDTRLTCTAKTVLTHLQCICNLDDSFSSIPEFSPQYIHYDEAKRQYFCVNLKETLYDCWKDGKLPFEKNVPWAKSPHEIIVEDI